MGQSVRLLQYRRTPLCSPSKHLPLFHPVHLFFASSYLQPYHMQGFAPPRAIVSFTLGHPTADSNATLAGPALWGKTTQADDSGTWSLHVDLPAALRHA